MTNSECLFKLHASFVICWIHHVKIWWLGGGFHTFACHFHRQGFPNIRCCRQRLVNCHGLLSSICWSLKVERKWSYLFQGKQSSLETSLFNVSIVDKTCNASLHVFLYIILFSLKRAMSFISSGNLESGFLLVF